MMKVVQQILISYTKADLNKEVITDYILTYPEASDSEIEQV